MANQNKNSSKSQLWVRVVCAVLGGLMVGGVVFMLIQMLMSM